MAWLAFGWAAVARAASLQLLGPSGAVSGEGFEVALRRADAADRSVPLVAPALTAENATVQELASKGLLHVFRVSPRAASASVALHARDGALRAHASFPVGPAEAKLSLSIDPEGPLTGPAQVGVRLEGAGEPVLLVTAGRLEPLRRVGVGEYEATYRPPSESLAEEALLVALAPWPFADAPEGAVAARWLSWRRAPSAGGTAARFGCVRTPPALPADGSARARILCAGSDAQGKPVAPTGAALVAQHGSVSGPRALEAGLLEWRYSAPRAWPLTLELLRAVWPGAASPWTIPLTLEQGPVTQASLFLPDVVAHRGGRLPLRVTARDSQGRLHSQTELSLVPSAGSLGALSSVDAGVFVAEYLPPREGGDERVDLTLTARDATVRPAARLLAWGAEGQLHAAVVDLSGRPLPDQGLMLDGVPVVTGPEGTVRLRPLAPGRYELRHGRWSDLRTTVHVLDEGRTVFPEARPTLPLPSRATLRLAPATPVVVRLEVVGRQVSYWVEDRAGVRLDGRAVRVSLSSGLQGPVRVVDGRSKFEVSTDRPSTVSVADVVTGVTALAEVRP